MITIILRAIITIFQRIIKDNSFYIIHYIYKLATPTISVLQCKDHVYF